MATTLLVEIPEKTSQKMDRMGVSAQELTEMLIHWIQHYLDHPHDPLFSHLSHLPSTQPPPQSLTSVLGSAQGGFATPVEADAFIRLERKAWTF